MKNILIAIFSLTCMATQAQTRAHDDVKFSLEVLRLAMISGDRAQLLQVTTPGLSYGHSSGVVETQEQFVEKLSSGKSDFVKIDISQETITVYKKTAIVRHLLQAETNDGGKPGTVKLYVMLVWIKEGKGWQLAARQALKVQ